MNQQQLSENAAPGVAPHPTHRAIEAAFDKLDGLLDRALGRGPDGARIDPDDRAIAAEKGRMLLELSRLSAPQTVPDAPGALVARAGAIRNRLVEEQRLLKRRMDAADVISALIEDAVLAAEWDGVYEPRGALTAPGPQRSGEVRPTPAEDRPRVRAHPKLETPE